jgi:predicted enzyme related to lactoylglutathione lyase
MLFSNTAERLMSLPIFPRERNPCRKSTIELALDRSQKQQRLLSLRSAGGRHRLFLSWEIRKGTMENLVVWFEIPVTDMERARKFYSDVFELDIEVQDSGDKPYGLFPMRGYGNSGALVKHVDFQPSAKAATIYLSGGRDLSVPLGRVEAAGGKILVPKTMISREMGYYALFLDSEGNRVGLHSMK